MGRQFSSRHTDPFDRLTCTSPTLQGDHLVTAKLPLPILFVHFGDQWIRGSETLLLDLLRHLDPAVIFPIVWCNGVELAEACRAAGYATHRSDFSFFFDDGSPRFNPKMYAGLVREGIALARRYTIRVLHANSAAPAQWLVPVARRLRLPVLAHLHIDYRRRSRFAMLLHQADSIVGVSRQVIDDFAVDGVAPGQARVIYNGIDFTRLTAPTATDLRPQLGIGEGVVTIGAVGSLIRRKGHDILIRAVAALADNGAPHLLVASDGPERAALQALAVELGVDHRVHFLGYHDPIVDLYRSVDIIVLASRADAFGLVLAEAGFSSLPVVSTTVGGIPEVVLDGQTGVLVAPDDVSALAGALARLIGDGELRRTLGAAGHRRATEVFSAQRMAEEFQVEYRRLAALPSGELGWRSVMRRLRPYVRLVRRAKAPA